jgi:hypothetical protein
MMGIVGFEILKVRASAGAALRKVLLPFGWRQELLAKTLTLANLFLERLGRGLRDKGIPVLPSCGFHSRKFRDFLDPRERLRRMYATPSSQVMLCSMMRKISSRFVVRLRLPYSISLKVGRFIFIS